eukprot:COSAG04_NODE_47_length_31265_cov_18.823012_2_plen_338_part_00
MPQGGATDVRGAPNAKDRQLAGDLWSRARRPERWSEDEDTSKKIVLEMWSRIYLAQPLQEPNKLQEFVETSMGVRNEQEIAEAWRRDVSDDVVASDNARFFPRWLKTVEGSDSDSESDSDPNTPVRSGHTSCPAYLDTQTEPEPEPEPLRRVENPMLTPEPLQKHTMSDILSGIEDVEAPSDGSKQQKSKKKNGGAAFEPRQGKKTVRVTQAQASPTKAAATTNAGRSPGSEPQSPALPSREREAARMSAAQATSMLDGLDAEPGSQTRPSAPGQPPARPPARQQPPASRSPSGQEQAAPMSVAQADSILDGLDPEPETAAGEDAIVRRTWSKPVEI